MRQFIEMVSGADSVESARIETWVPRAKRSKLDNVESSEESLESEDADMTANNTNGNAKEDETNGNAPMEVDPAPNSRLELDCRNLVGSSPWCIRTRIMSVVGSNLWG